MLACTQKITLVQRHYDSDTDIDRYVQTEITGVSWHGKVKIEVQDKGVRSADVVKIRIPEKQMPEGVRISNGDYIVRGETGQQCITKQEDLRGLEYITVISVGDNRRGNLRHWAVIGT